MDLFAFQKRFRRERVKMLPDLEDLSDYQVRKLPAGGVSHLEWRIREAFGKEVRVLLVWIVGGKLPLRWDNVLHRWVDDNGK